MSPNIVKSYSTPGSTLDRRRDFHDSNRGAERPYVALVTICPTRPPGRCRPARDPDAAAGAFAIHETRIYETTRQLFSQPQGGREETAAGLRPAGPWNDTTGGT